MLPTRRRGVPVRGCRGIGPGDLVRNDRLGEVTVDPTTGAVRLDGDLMYAEPADRVSLSRLYFL